MTKKYRYFSWCIAMVKGPKNEFQGFLHSDTYKVEKILVSETKSKIKNGEKIFLTEQVWKLPHGFSSEKMRILCWDDLEKKIKKYPGLKPFGEYLNNSHEMIEYGDDSNK